MHPREALTCDDATLRDLLAGLDDHELAQFLAAVDTVDLEQRTRPLDLGSAALFYATTLRWPVFPLKPRGKAPLTSHGFKDASTDPDIIRGWWQRWPTANIGAPTGAGGIGYDVIDIDGRPGIASLARLKHAHCPADCSAVTFCAATGELPPVHASAMTPGGDDGPGFHYFISPTGDGNGTSIDHGIDYRGAGGYVVIPPSVGPNGTAYTWVTRPAVAA